MKPGNRTKRSGAILIAVLVTLIVVVSIIGASMLVTMRGHRQCKIERQLAQLEFLCEAGAERSSQLLQKDSSYVGDRWVPNLGDQTREHAEIETRIVYSDDGSASKIEVTAVLEGGPYLQRIQRTTQYPLPYK